MSYYPEKREGKLTGRWRIEVQRSGKRIVKFTTNRKAAHKLNSEIEAGLHDTVSIVETSSNYTLAKLTTEAKELWDGTRDAKQSIARCTAFLGLLASVLKDNGLPDDITAIRPAHTAEAQRRLRAQGIKNATINRYTSAASKALKWALEEELIEDVPRLRWHTEPVKEVFHLSQSDEDKMVKRLLSRGHDDCLLIMQVQLTTGCRIDEVLRLTPETITNDGDGFYSLDLGVTKNGQERSVALPEDLGAKFLALVMAGLPSYRSVWRRLKRARVKCGLPTTQPTHAHRHTIATRLAGMGTNALVLADFMGHQSLTTTKRYVHNDLTTKKSVLKSVLLKQQDQKDQDNDDCKAVT